MTVNYEDISAKLKTELSKLVPPGVQLDDDADLVTGLGLDSFKVLDLLLDIEDEFDISMPVNLLVDVRTVKDLADKIHEQVNSSR